MAKVVIADQEFLLKQIKPGRVYSQARLRDLLSGLDINPRLIYLGNCKQGLLLKQVSPSKFRLVTRYTRKPRVPRKTRTP
jgi:hypothetical protein